MKYLFVFIIGVSAICSTAQEPFEKEDKWGISRDGDGGAEDSIIFRAEFDEIQMDYSLDYGYLYSGLKNDEWQLLTSNKLVNQQRYETVEVLPFADKYVLGYRDGYVDLISLETTDFIVRGVNADAIIDGGEDIGEEVSYVMTKKGKGMFGFIDPLQKKELVKAQYAHIQTNNFHEADYQILAHQDGKTDVYSNEGELRFMLSTEIRVVGVHLSDNIPGCFEIVGSNKGVEKLGFYDSKGKWLIQPIYEEVLSLDNTSDAIVVYDKKGYGLFFQGKQIVECLYDSVEKSDKRGFLAIVENKKGIFYVTPEGKLHQPQNH